MMSFRGNRLAETQLPLGTVWLLEKLAESKGKQALYEKQSPQILKALREMALVESTESSNRIEGVTVERERLRPLALGNARPRDRSEEEIVGYRRALSRIHTNQEKIPIEPETFKRLHGMAQGGTVGDAGEWKQTQNEIVEIYPDRKKGAGVFSHLTIYQAIYQAGREGSLMKRLSRDAASEGLPAD